jgi:alkanesulfonate monooxygenase SsuD/methylene tetrahydromethanopterin reductase-like flavin-dependent oxidoreductase (luciferase family)
VLLAPLLNPLALAEELATLDVLSDGRIIAGFGAGYRKVECEAFAVEWADRGVRLREYVPILRALWAGEPVTAGGSWGRLEKATVRLRPVQDGGPPIWLGALAPAGIRRAARLGATWLIGPEGDNDDLAARLALYRDELTNQGHDLGRPYPLMREAAIADTTEEAVDLIRPHLAAQYAAYRSWDAAQKIDVEEFIRTHCVVGDPATVVARLRELEALGITHVVVRLQFVGTPHDVTLEGIRRLGEQVLPALGAAADQAAILTSS